MKTPSKATILGVAYAATAGGIATLIGTPPNAIAYSTGKIKVKEMIKVGLILDLTGCITAITLKHIIF